MTRRTSVVAVLGGMAVLGLLTTLDPHAVRMAAALLLCLVLPGLGWARRLRLRDRGDTAAMTVVLSLSATAIVATGMAVLGRWSPTGGLALLAVVGVLGVVPIRSTLRRTAIIVLGLPEPIDDDERTRRAAEAQQAEEEWIDWYAGARARRDAELREQAAAAAAAEQEWRDWISSQPVR